MPASSSPFSVTNLLRAPVDVCWEKLAAGEAWGLVLASANWAVGVDDGVAGAGGVVFSSVGLVVMVVVVVVVGFVVGLVVRRVEAEGVYHDVVRRGCNLCAALRAEVRGEVCRVEGVN